MAGAALLALLVAPAQAERVVYIGTFNIISKTENGKCSDYDPVGDRGMVRYRPKIQGNPDNSRTQFGWFYQDGGRGYQIDGDFNGDYQKAQAVNVFDGFDTPQPAQQIRYLSQKPATIKNNTTTIEIVGQILNYDWMKGCEIKFRMVLQKRVG